MKFEDVVNKTILKYYPVIFGSLFMIEWFITEFNLDTDVHIVTIYIFLITMIWVAQNIRSSRNEQ